MCWHHCFGEWFSLFSSSVILLVGPVSFYILFSWSSRSEYRLKIGIIGSPLLPHLEKYKPVSHVPGICTALPLLTAPFFFHAASWHSLEDVLPHSTPSRDGSYPHQLTLVLISCKLPQDKEETSFKKIFLACLKTLSVFFSSWMHLAESIRPQPLSLEQQRIYCYKLSWSKS